MLDKFLRFLQTAEIPSAKIPTTDVIKLTELKSLKAKKKKITEAIHSLKSTTSNRKYSRYILDKFLRFFQTKLIKNLSRKQRYILSNFKRSFFCTRSFRSDGLGTHVVL